LTQKLVRLPRNGYAARDQRSAAQSVGVQSRNRWAAEQAGFIVCPVVLFHRAAVYDSPLPGLSVEEYEPDGKAAQEIAQLYKYTTLLHNSTGKQDEQTKAQQFSSRS
jgi:hypothetical protein